MLKKLNIKVVLMFLIICGLTGSILQAEEIPTIEFIKASLKNQENLSYPALRVKCQITILTDGEKENSEIISQYVRTPNCFFMETKHFKGEELKFTYKGKYERNSGTRKEISISQSDKKFGEIDMGLGPILSGIKLETTYFPILLKNSYFLYDALEKGKVTGEQKVIDGHKCWLVKISEGDICYNIWLGQDIGFCPVLIERTTNNKIEDTVEFFNYKEVCKDFWFPMKMTTEGNAPRGLIKNIWKVEEISVGKAISEEETKIEFLPGTVVSDLTTGTTFEITKK